TIPPRSGRGGRRFKSPCNDLLDHLVDTGEQRRRHVERDSRKRALQKYLAGIARDQSALMPANFTTLAHFSVSLARRWPKLAGGPGSIVPPISASRTFALGSARIALISMLSRPMTSGGVFLGAMMPKNALAS